jgi:DNA-directed RNA polymerase subunit RPC12/RpoP
MKKALFFGILMIAVGFILWRMIASEFFNPAEELAAGVNRENFSWFTCSSCGKLFMAEVTTLKGRCPYCNTQMMLVTEDRRVMGRSVDESEFIWFFSPQCGKVFFAYNTGNLGTCPYCGESIELTAPLIADLKEESAAADLRVWAKAHASGLLFGALAVLVVSLTCIYLLLERRVMLSLEPVGNAVSENARIELSKRQIRKKQLTLGNEEDSDVILSDPSMKGHRYVLSFVRVGGKMHAYLHHGSNKPIKVNQKPEYNPRLKDSDEVTLGDVVFKVHTRDA